MRLGQEFHVKNSAQAAVGRTGAREIDVATDYQRNRNFTAKLCLLQKR